MDTGRIFNFYLLMENIKKLDGGKHVFCGNAGGLGGWDN